MACVRRPLKHAIGLGLLSCAVTAYASLARAQTCHGQFRSNVADEAGRATVGLNFLSAGFETPRFTGHYEGLGAELGWAQGRGQLAATWNAYRLSKNGADIHGVGDPALAARVRLTEESAALRVGAGLAAAAPVGDAKHELGMGHFMVTPEVWGELGSQRRYLASSLAFSRALGAGAHHEHGLSPLVAPMTASEVTLDLRGGLRALPNLALEARGRLAFPAGVEGDARAHVTGVVAIPFAGGESAVELSLPLAAESFDWRFGTSLRWFL
jgi:hypothetical protein